MGAGLRPLWQRHRKAAPGAGCTKTSITGRGTFVFLASLTCAFVALFAFSGGAGAMVGTGGAGTAPWISSDMPDYPPGALVTLISQNWQPGEAVHINVNDDAGQTWSRNVDLTADSNG